MAAVTDAPAGNWPEMLFERFQIDRVLDVGANLGGWVESWLTLGAHSVHAVEPVPDCHAELTRRFAGDSRVISHRLGVSDTEHVVEELNIFNAWSLLPDASKALERAIEFRDTPPFSVQFTTIDALLAREHFAPGLIKLDVDGYEAKALRGAREFMARSRPVVMFEASYLPFFYDDCCECMIRGIFALDYVITTLDRTRTFADSRDFMRVYPWDTSFDVLLVPRERAADSRAAPARDAQISSPLLH